MAPVPEGQYAPAGQPPDAAPCAQIEPAAQGLAVLDVLALSVQ
jgi:hypothetical protein